jgi:hypothetical protein
MICNIFTENTALLYPAKNYSSGEEWGSKMIRI